MSFLVGVDPGVVAALDQRYAETGAAVNAVVAGVTGKCETPIETYARLAMAIPEEMDEATVRNWLCVALTRLAHLEK